MNTSPLMALLICAATASSAYRKGYNPVLWFFAGGPIGILTLLVLPDTKKVSRTDEENIRLRKRGDKIGAVLIGLFVGAIAVFWLVQQH